MSVPVILTAIAVASFTVSALFTWAGHRLEEHVHALDEQRRQCTAAHPAAPRSTAEFRPPPLRIEQAN